MGRGAWWAAVHGVAKSRTRLSDFTFMFHFHASEKEMATHSSVLAWRIPGTGEPGGLPSMRSHRVGHDWSDLAAAREGHLAENGCMYMYGWVLSLFTWSHHNVVSWLFPNTKCFWCCLKKESCPEHHITFSCHVSSWLWPCVWWFWQFWGVLVSSSVGFTKRLELRVSGGRSES